MGILSREPASEVAARGQLGIARSARPEDPRARALPSSDNRLTGCAKQKHTSVRVAQPHDDVHGDVRSPLRTVPRDDFIVRCGLHARPLLNGRGPHLGVVNHPAGVCPDARRHRRTVVRLDSKHTAERLAIGRRDRHEVSRQKRGECQRLAISDDACWRRREFRCREVRRRCGCGATADDEGEAAERQRDAQHREPPIRPPLNSCARAQRSGSGERDRTAHSSTPVWDHPVPSSAREGGKGKEEDTPATCHWHLASKRHGEADSSPDYFPGEIGCGSCGGRSRLKRGGNPAAANDKRGNKLFVRRRAAAARGSSSTAAGRSRPAPSVLGAVRRHARQPYRRIRPGFPGDLPRGGTELRQAAVVCRRDPIIDELHRVREDIGKAHDFDVRQIATKIRCMRTSAARTSVSRRNATRGERAQR